MTNRVLCPFHEENTPSCVLYGDYYKCFGCGKHGHIRELNMIPEVRKTMIQENLEEKYNYVRTLPTKEIRGLHLPYDIDGYYILYPTKNYYIKRLFNGAEQFKYKSPAGHSKPLFELETNLSVPLFIVEGQLNALSLYKANLNISIVSPGSAVDFCKSKFIEHYLQYKNIVICSDLDIAGVQYGKKLQKMLLESEKNVVFYPMDEDFNQILQQKGVEGVTREAKEALALLRMPDIRKG